MNEVIIYGKGNSDKRRQSGGDCVDGVNGVVLGLVVWLFVDGFTGV